MQKEKLVFILKGSALYFLAYFFIGAIAYQLFTKQFYIGNNPIFSFMRSENNPTEWAHVMTWLFPGQLLRGALIVSVISLFQSTLKNYSFWRRFFVIFSLFFVLSHIASTAPSPSNIEGLIYMKSQFISLKSFLLTQPEMILQSFFFAIGLSYLVEGKKLKETFRTK